MPDIERINNILRAVYPDAVCSLNYSGDPWRLLIAARLSAQCTDERVNIVCVPLFERYPDAAAMAAADIDELEGIVRPCGLYRTKAASCRDMSRIICEEYGGEVPDTMEGLLSLPGVGRKIANLILGDVFGKPGIVADTHCIRLNGRFGFYPKELKDPAKVERILDEIVPKEEQASYCHRMVMFGREYCRAQSPQCGICPLSGECDMGKEISPSPVLEIPEPASFVLERLRERGYTGYCVGGCVRDCLMGRIPGDYDVTTSAKPDEMKEAFADSRVVETGLKHGTLTIVRGGMNIETTTYRIDGTYGDGRHPENVTFTDKLSDDLCRRDFTINAMAYSPIYGVVDIYGGRADIVAKKIRCVGRAKERFSEDGLRILRALRFSSVLGFTPDEECSSAVHSMKGLLEKISRERIHAEIRKLLCGEGAADILYGYADVISFVFPALYENGVREAARFISREKSRRAETRYALLFSSLEGKELNDTVNSLKPSNGEKKAILSLVNEKQLPDDTYGVLKLMGRYGDDFPSTLAGYLSAMGKCTDEEADYVTAEASEAVKNNTCRRADMLSIDGNTLRNAGYSGAEIGRAIQTALDGVMFGEVKNKPSALMEYIRNNGRD